MFLSELIEKKLMSNHDALKQFFSSYTKKNIKMFSSSSVTVS